MEKIPTPKKIEIQPGQNPNSANISIEPCYPGYGITLGNSLRRVLISSLPGVAVIAYKIKGVLHEFSTIEHVKEDMVEISLNLKKLRLKILNDDETVKLELKEKGEKKVTAKDIKTPANVEIINPELLIATLTDKNADFDMEIIAKRGRGYIPSENQKKDDLEVNMIVIDSLFSPVKKVGFKIENVRVGQMTNWDKLILNIETDGSITPKDVLYQAVNYIIDNFEFIRDNLEPQKAVEIKKEEALKELEDKKEKENGDIKTEEKVQEKDKESKEMKEELIEEKRPKKRGRPRKKKEEE